MLHRAVIQVGRIVHEASLPVGALGRFNAATANSCGKNGVVCALTRGKIISPVKR